MSDLNEIWSDCSCRYEFCQLIDDLIKDIQHLESETVRTRYELSRHLEYPYDEYLGYSQHTCKNEPLHG